jgi:hypothetical protein
MSHLLYLLLYYYIILYLNRKESKNFYVRFAKLHSSRRKMVQQCVIVCILCHNIVLGGNSVVEVSAVCYSRYENGRPENVSSGFNILINQRTA